MRVVILVGEGEDIDTPADWSGARLRGGGLTSPAGAGVAWVAYRRGSLRGAPGCLMRLYPRISVSWMV
jgi:hypothetical protein